MLSCQLWLVANRKRAEQILKDVCLHSFNLQPIPAGDRLKLRRTCRPPHLGQPTLELLNALFGYL